MVSLVDVTIGMFFFIFMLTREIEWMKLIIKMKVNLFHYREFSNMAIRVVEFSSGGYKIRKIFA